MTLTCPKCGTPIPAEAIVREAASINAHKAPKGEGARPGAVGLRRNPAGRPPKKKEPRC